MSPVNGPMPSARRAIVTSLHASRSTRRRRINKYAAQRLMGIGALAALLLAGLNAVRTPVEPSVSWLLAGPIMAWADTAAGKAGKGKAGKAGKAGKSVKSAMVAHPGLVDASTVVPELQLDLRYASSDNFLGRAVYGDLDTCFLQKDAAEMLARAQALLIEAHPDWRLRVFDCARPRWVQREMWKLVVGTPQQSYVANPARGSIHNFGCAVDLTIATRAGTPLDMGTPHDFFGPLARPDRERVLLARAELMETQVANRVALRDVMQQAGFRMLASEWWHFDCTSRQQTRSRYRIIP